LALRQGLRLGQWLVQVLQRRLGQLRLGLLVQAFQRRASFRLAL